MDLVRKCSDGSEILTDVGKKNTPWKQQEDRVVWLKAPSGKNRWKVSFDCIGQICRLYGEVEENLYPRAAKKQGRNKILHFIKDCITRPHWTIEQCCYEHQIPGYEDKHGLAISQGSKRQKQLGFTNIGLRVIFFLFLLIEAFRK